MDQDTLDTIRREVVSRYAWNYAMLYASIALVAAGVCYLVYDIWRYWRRKDP